ncbi:hypothetical protein MMC07_000110 [Pseudocyphellaria aurata]|nr:hypothetical protein [Pseudocyphellaria aurata]
MAPSSGHLLVPKALRVVKFAISQTTALIRSKLTKPVAGAILQPIRVHSNTHPTHPLALLKQSRSQHRSYSAVRNNSSRSSPRFIGRYDRSSFPVSKVSKTIVRQGAAPFASALRPNLTGGALPRSAGGYSLGGGGLAGRGARHFSHTPSAQAHVVQNVSAGIRAFIVGGGKARFDGLDGRTGEKRYKAVSRTEDEVLQKIEKPFKTYAKGTNLEFQLSPTVTAFSTKISTTDSTVDVQTLLCDEVLSNISIDFARALKDLTAVLADLHRLSTLGDLPITLSHSPSGPILNCRFPGCDAGTVSRLCEEVNIQRGIVREDEAWERDRDVEMALLFPFAPGTIGPSEIADDEAKDCFGPASAASEQLDWRHMMAPQESFVPIDELTSNDGPVPGGRRASVHQNSKSLSGYESLGESDFTEADPYVRVQETQTRELSATSGSEGYEGLEGIYRFLQECEDARR